MLDRKQETKLIKDTLLKSGYQNIKVSHGHGTAWGWVTVDVDIIKPDNCECAKTEFTCEYCRAIGNSESIKVTEIILATTQRRRGEYDGNTLVNINMIDKTPEAIPAVIPVVKNEPIPYTSRETRRDIRMNHAAESNYRMSKRTGYVMYY